jgi:hypothetical protein
MTDIQADRKADGVKVEQQHESAGSSPRPNFDVIGLLKEGAQGAGVVGKDIVNGVVSAAKDVGNFLDIPAMASSGAEPPAQKSYDPYYNYYADHDSDTEQTCEGDVGMTLMFPAGIAGLFAGTKVGLETGFLVGGPSGAGLGALIGMGLGTIAGVGADFYGVHKGCEFLDHLSDT